MSGALDGLLVLDLCQWTPGPLCAMVLGDLGADVVKVERPGGEDGRRAQPTVSDVSLYYALNNRNKRSVTINLKMNEGRDLLRRLVRRADIVLESYRPGWMASVGLGYENLRAMNPGIVLASLTAFGQTGPYRDRGGFDMIAQAMGGLMSLNGEPDGPPLKAATSPAAVVAGLHAAVAVLAALRHRDRTGEGQWIDIALLDCAVAQVEADLPHFALRGEALPRMGNRRLYTAPTNAYEALDGLVYIAPGNDALWRKLCDAMGRPELADDARFVTNADRCRNAVAVDAAVALWVRTQPVTDVVEALVGRGVPCGPVNPVGALFDDPQVRSREMIVTVEHPQLGALAVPGQPIKMTATPPCSGGALAEPGEHNHQAFAELLGASARDVDGWAAAGII